MEIVAFIIGLGAFAFYILSVQHEEKGNLLKFQIVANILYGIQYLILGVYIAALMNLISVLRLISFYKYHKDKKEVPAYTAVIFIFLIFLAGLLQYDPNIIGATAIFINLIPVLITLLYTLSTWKNNMKVIRYVFAISAIFWIIYNYSVGAYASLIGNVFEFSSGVIAIIRYRKTK